MSLYNKVCGTLARLIKGYKQDLLYSHALARTRLVSSVAGYCRLKRINKELNEREQQLILEQLTDMIKNVLMRYQSINDQGTVQKDAPIWVFWWTGISDAPDLVIKCIDSIQKHRENHPVYFLDRYNLADYIDIPEYMLEKVIQKKICLANFSDYIRFSLLNRYGGLWIDATVFLSESIPQCYFELPLFSCNTSSSTSWVSNGKWTAFVFGGWRGHVLFRFMQDAFEQYWQNYDAAIDYLLVDYLVRIAYMNLSIVRNDIDKVPINNLHRNDLRAAMNRAEPAEKYSQFLFADTCFNKLSWRETYPLRDKQGNETIYSAFLEQIIEEN